MIFQLTQQMSDGFGVGGWRIYQTLVRGQSSLLLIMSCVCLLKTPTGLKLLWALTYCATATSILTLWSCGLKCFAVSCSTEHISRNQSSHFFHLLCRFSEIWAQTCWRRHLRATTPASSRMARPARGSPSPWWEILWDKTLDIFDTLTFFFLIQKDTEREISFKESELSVCQFITEGSSLSCLQMISESASEACFHDDFICFLRHY